VQVAEATAAELSAGAQLKELLAGRIPPATQEGLAALAAAIAAAEPFASLASDVEAAKELHHLSCARAELAAQLQAVVDRVAHLTSKVTAAPGSSGSSGGGTGHSSVGGSGVERNSSSGGGRQCDALGLPLQGFSMSDWQQHVATLEAAVEPAKDANVSVTKVCLRTVPSEFWHHQGGSACPKECLLVLCLVTCRDITSGHSACCMKCRRDPSLTADNAQNSFQNT
jgi:hypothetical protein